MNDLTGAGEIAKQAVEIVKAKPIYEDVLQPGAQEVGKALGTVGKAVNAALLPLRVVVWGLEQVEAYLKPSLEARLKDVPPECITTPDPQIIGPAVESMRFVANNPTLREMYASLIATAMDSRHASIAHPAFVEALKQLTPAEARILALINAMNVCVISVDAEFRIVPSNRSITGHIMPFWADIHMLCGYDDPSLTEAYLINLIRLGLIVVQFDLQQFTADAEATYRRMENSPYLAAEKLQATKDSGRSADCSGEIVEDLAFTAKRGLAGTTKFGMQLCKACGLHDSPEMKR